MNVKYLVEMLLRMPLDAEVLIASEDEGCLEPVVCRVEYDHGDDTPFVRLYVENGEVERSWLHNLLSESAAESR